LIPDAWVDTVRNDYQNDEYFRDALDYIKNKADGKKAPGDVRRHAEHLSVDEHGMVFNTQVPGHPRLSIPAGAGRDALMKQLHTKLLHPSARAMCADISEQLFIPGLPKICEHLTKTCHECYTSRPSTHAMGLYARRDIPKYPFHTFSMDVATSVPEVILDKDPKIPVHLRRKVNAVLVIIDELTKTVIYIPTSSSATGLETVQLLRDRVFAYYGTPTTIKSDNGSIFKSDEVQMLLFGLNITLSPSVPHYHTHIVERAVQELRLKIRLIVDGDGRGWLNKLGEFQLAINRTKATEGDQLSPSERLLGYILPSSLLTNPTLHQPATSAATRETGWIRPTIATLIDNLLESQAQLAKEHDHGRHPSKIGVGSQVAIPYDAATGVPMTWHPNKVAAKSRPLYVGPFTVISRLEGDNCCVSLGYGKTPKFHVSMLKHLDSATRAVPVGPDQPEELCWPDGKPKVRIVTRRRYEGTKTQYLVHFWGQHEVKGSWLTADKVATQDRVYLSDYDRRYSQDQPSKFNPDDGLDLSVPPGTPSAPQHV